MPIRTTVYLDDALHSQLRRHALDTGTTMSQLITRYSLAGLAADAAADAHNAALSVNFLHPPERTP